MSFERKIETGCLIMRKKVCQQINLLTDVDGKTLLIFICHEKGTYFKRQLDLLKKKYSKQFSYKLCDICIGDMKI